MEQKAPAWMPAPGIRQPGGSTILLSRGFDTERNNHTVRTIGINSIGAISLPNHTLFPPVQVTKIAIGTGDGVKRLQHQSAVYHPEFRDHIYQQRGADKRTDYEIDYENNFCDMRENYHTAGLTCRMDNVSFNLKTAVKSGSNYRDPIAWWDCYEANQSFLLYGK